MNNFYEVIFECSNCKNRFSKFIKIGEKSKGNGGVCPVCRIEDSQESPFQVLHNERVTNLLME